MYYETNKTASELADVALMEALVAADVISVEKVTEMRTDYDIAEVVINSTEEFTQINEEDIGPPFTLSFRVCGFPLVNDKILLFCFRKIY